MGCVRLKGAGGATQAVVVNRACCTGWARAAAFSNGVLNFLKFLKPGGVLKIFRYYGVSPLSFILRYDK